MAIIFLHRHEILDKQWDDFIAASSQSILYAYSWYLDAVSPNWGALVLEEAGEWRAVMPLPIRAKGLLKVVQQPFYCQLLGVFTPKNVNLQTQLLIQKLPDYFRYMSVYTGRFPLDLSFTDNYKVSRCTTHILPLNSPYIFLKQHYTPDRQLNLRRAEKYGWRMVENEDINPMVDLFRRHHAAQIEGGVSENAYDLLHKVFAILEEKKAVRLVYALKEEQIEAGAMFAIFDQRIIYLFNAASAIGRKGNARTLLIDHILQEYAETDYVFDFESPEIKDIADFYQSFGAKEEVYINLHYNNLPFPLKQIQEWRRGNGTARAVKRGIAGVG